MRKIYTLALIILVVLPMFSQELPVSFKSGEFKLTKNNIFSFTSSDPYRILTFKNLPTKEVKQEISDLGIELLYYLPSKMFVASMGDQVSNQDINSFGIISVNEILSDYKIDPKLQNENFPDWSYKNDFLYINLLLYKDVDISRHIEEIEILSESVVNINANNNSITVAIEPSKLGMFAEFPFIFFIEPIDPPGKPENYTAETLHRSNVINTRFTNGRHYNGDGVTVLMQDDGYVQPHIDRQGRIDESFCNGCSTSSGNDHGDHCSGTIMGAGNLDPLAKGMADGAFLYTMGYSTLNYTDANAFPLLHTNYDVVITSTSYSNGCNAGYTSLSRDIDEQNNTYPNLIHVFSAGNDGGSNCGYGAGSGWANVTGGHKQAKNVIAVANLTVNSSLANSSSRGPAADGRIKPDIGAKGTSVYSTEHNNTYGVKTGTSMSCPGVAGVMAQLYQAYKEINNVSNPPSALMKCVLLNSADDIGNPGPDFKHGWGEVNSYRAVKILENGFHMSGSISQSTTNTHSITVPANTDQVKVMVYWHDKEASTSASKALVNDINIQLLTPSAISYNPWVLDPTPNSSILDQDAVRGVDDLNNMEQITIDNPSAGNYILSVDGFTVPFGPQDYYVTYEFITSSVELTYPIGGESLVPGDSEYIRWDTHQSGSISIQYSSNGGTNWNTIASNVQASNRYYIWNVPNDVTANALIRINGSNNTSQSTVPFTIIDVPNNFSVYWPCPDSINVSWNNVNGATSYEVSMLGQRYMDSIFTTSNTNVWIINPDPSITNSWFSVKANINNGKGRRAIAENAQAINAQCSGYGCTDPAAFNYSNLAIINDGSCCYYSGCTDLTAINYDSLACFDDGSCIAPILGCTNPLSSNFDPNANTSIAFGGALDNSFASGGYFTGNQHLIFNATKSCIIKSVVIYAQSSNTVTFELRDINGAIIDDTTHAITSGQQTIALNFDVPIANDMQLGISAANSGLYRNNANASYPYDIGSAISITASSASSAPQDYYYFFYNIKIEATCSNIMMPVYGCTDSTAHNYNSLANTDDGTCCYASGCTDPFAINYDPNACFDDSTCTDAVLGCSNVGAINYNANANTSVAYGGELDSTFGTGGYFYSDQHLIFDANQICILKSADLNSELAGNITFELRDNNGIVIDDTTLSIVVGPQRIDLNFDVPFGNDMQLGVSSGALANSGLYRNNAGASYPYGIGSVINITGSSANAAGYYYFFYNIEVGVECLVESWDCDGQGNCFDPANGLGVYSTYSDCQTECLNVSTNDIGLQNLRVYPNPSKGIFNIDFISTTDQSVSIKVVNMLGENIFVDRLNKFLGTYTKRIDLSNDSEGLYFLEIVTQKGIVNKKLTLY